MLSDGDGCIQYTVTHGGYNVASTGELRAQSGPPNMSGGWREVFDVESNGITAEVWEVAVVPGPSANKYLDVSVRQCGDSTTDNVWAHVSFDKACDW